MKKYIFLIIVFVASMMSAQRIPVVSDSTYFYADSISSTITVQKNIFISQIWLDKSRTLNLTPQFYDPQKGNWHSVLSLDTVFYYITDSTVYNVIPLEWEIYNSAKYIRFLLDNDIADTLTMRYDGRPY
jgi:hypothetical protein